MRAHHRPFGTEARNGAGAPSPRFTLPTERNNSISVASPAGLSRNYTDGAELRRAPRSKKRARSSRAPASCMISAQATGTAFSFQICSAYSRIVRSLENFPIRAVFRMAIFAQAFWSR